MLTIARLIAIGCLLSGCSVIDASSGGDDKSRALELAQQARDGFVAEGETAAPYVAEVDTWLAEHR